MLIIDRAQRSGALGAAGRGGVSDDGAAPIVGSSAAIRAVRARIERVAATGFTVLIEGESGVGKELVARQIHELSPRRDGPFVAVNCAAIVETLLEAELFGIEERIATGVRGRRGKFEHAHGGTLFLDEVADLSAVRAGETAARHPGDVGRARRRARRPREVDTRIIAATNQSCRELVARGRFRLDLFYRLHGVEIDRPAAAGAARTTSWSWPSTSSSGTASSGGCGCRRRRPTRCSRIAGRATCVSSSASSSAPSRWRIPDRLQLDDLPPALLDGYAQVLLPSFRQFDSMRAWGSRYARMVFERCEQQQAADVPRTGDLVPHAAMRISGSNRTAWPGCLRQAGWRRQGG